MLDLPLSADRNEIAAGTDCLLDIIGRHVHIEHHLVRSIACGETG